MKEKMGGKAYLLLSVKKKVKKRETEKKSSLISDGTGGLLLKRPFMPREHQSPGRCGNVYASKHQQIPATDTPPRLHDNYRAALVDEKYIYINTRTYTHTYNTKITEQCVQAKCVLVLN